MSLEFYDRQGKPITLEEWGVLAEDDNYRRVARTEVGHIVISTVWLGLNHNWWPGSPPVFFETMIFGGPHDMELWRMPNEISALAAHDQAVALCRAKVKKST